MQLSRVNVLNDDEIKKIHNASMEILGEVGIHIKSRDALLFLEDKGLKVDHDKYIVKFNPGVVKKAIDSTPEEFELFSRDRSYSFKIGIGEDTKTAAGFDGIYTYDYKKKTRTPTTKEEVGIFARLSNNLDDIDVVATQAMPQDVHSKSSLLHGVDAVLNNTIKPIIFAPEKKIEVESIIEMIKIAIDNDNINIKPIGICHFSPSSPLFWNAETIDGFMKIAKEGFPCIILPGPIMGATAPYTIAGELVQKNCEILSGIVVAQLVNKGTPLLYCNSGVQFDMKSAAAIFSTPENFIINVAGTQLAHFYNIPSHGCIPTSDSHDYDEQHGFENMLSYMSGFESGTDLVVNAGMFSSGKVSSFEQLIIDNEMIKIVRRYLEGIEINNETLAVDAIKRVGPGGNFLSDESTLKSLRSRKFSESDIINRKDVQVWLKDGSRTIVENASDKVKRMLKSIDAPVLEKDKRKKIEKIISNFEKRYK